MSEITEVEVTEDHRQAASMFFCWPMNVIDLCKRDKDLPRAVAALALFIAKREHIALLAAQSRTAGEGEITNVNAWFKAHDAYHRAVEAYNTRVVLCRAERQRDNWTMSTHAEYSAMHDAQKATHRADAELYTAIRNSPPPSPVTEAGLTGERETKIAKIIDPTAWTVTPETYGLKTEEELMTKTMAGGARLVALDKARRILTTPPDAGRVPEWLLTAVHEWRDARLALCASKINTPECTAAITRLGQAEDALSMLTASPATKDGEGQS